MAAGAADEGDLGGYPVQRPAPPYTLRRAGVTLLVCATGMNRPVLLLGRGWRSNGDGEDGGG